MTIKNYTLTDDFGFVWDTVDSVREAMNIVRVWNIKNPHITPNFENEEEA